MYDMFNMSCIAQQSSPALPVAPERAGASCEACTPGDYELGCDDTLLERRAPL